MLNPFPDLLVYSILAPFLIRIAAGATLFYMAVSHYRSRGEIAKLVSPLIGSLSKFTGPLLALFEIFAGLLLIVGLYTQVAALLGILLVVKSLLVRRKLTSLAPLSHAAYMLILIMCLSLLFSGAGGFAFDIPL